jgi:hypothetical protein
MISPSIIDTPKSVADHWDILWYLVVILLGAALAEIRIFLYKLAKNQEDLKNLHTECQLNLKDHYISASAFNSLLQERKTMWRDIFFPHTHFPSGEVKINRCIIPFPSEGESERDT